MHDWRREYCQANGKGIPGKAAWKKDQETTCYKHSLERVDLKILLLLYAENAKYFDLYFLYACKSIEYNAVNFDSIVDSN